MAKESYAALLEHFKKSKGLIVAEMSKAIVGQTEVIDQMLAAILSRGHCLLVGVPGLAKTMMVSTLAEIMTLSFKRIQFTPDLMPSDITGTEFIQEDKLSGTRQLQFIKGPVFANVILADEINRTPPKTQAALLEAMQEHQLTVGGKRYRLDEPFFVLATQNPIEQEGTYPLPEAQLDRFMFNTFVDYPDEEEELEIIRRTTADVTAEATPTLEAAEILELQRIVRRVPVADHVARYALALARLTRPAGNSPPEFIRKYVSWGAGPRASQYLVLGAKARAVLYGRHYADTDDIRSVAYPVLRHRIITNFNAEAEGVKPDDVVRRLIELAADEEDRQDARGRIPQVFRSRDPGQA